MTPRDDAPSVPRTEPGHGVSFGEAARFWVKLGFINFGGPTGQIALMHEELVERRRWISNRRFLHALNYCMLLPGPEAQQLAIYIGWLLHKVRGGMVAGIGFILPAFFLMLALSWTYAVHGDLPAVAGVFFGLQSAVVGIVAAALIRIARRTLRNGLLAGIAALSFVAIFLAHVPFPVILGAAGLIGFVGGRVRPGRFVFPELGEGEENRAAVKDVGPEPEHTRPDAARSIRVILVGLTAWIVPLALISIAPGAPPVIGQEALFFSQAALITFGGAYAVLSYINQAAVFRFGWLLPGQMATGLGLAESTPGPLIMVTEFVGFLGAFRHPGTLAPVWAGVLGAFVTVWATFAPCFLWIFLGGPYIERLRGNHALTTTLTAVTAAVVGVILNLAVTLAIQTLFDQVRFVRVLGGPVPLPAWSSLDPFAVALAAVSFVALWRFRVNVMWVVGVAAALGGLRVLV